MCFSENMFLLKMDRTIDKSRFASPLLGFLHYLCALLSISVQLLILEEIGYYFQVIIKLKLKNPWFNYDFVRCTNINNFILLQEGSSRWCQVAGLTVTSVRPSDQGEYSFLVRSSRGLAEATLLLNVSHDGSLTSASSSSSSTTTYYRYSLHFYQIIFLFLAILWHPVLMWFQ